MKKIMFDDKYGLTDAVLEGRKTMTRRVIINLDNYDVHNSIPTYKIGEEVAIAQKYLDLCNCDAFYEALHKSDPTFPLECIKYEKGCNNKMFVKAKWMPHRIRITDIKVERLQSISEDDVFKEGLELKDGLTCFETCDDHNVICSNDPRAAFAFLIDKLMGRGTWEKNPYVYAYEFRLIR